MITMDQKNLLCALGLFETCWILGNKKTSTFENLIPLYQIFAQIHLILGT